MRKFTLVGGGLAGLSLAESLVEHGVPGDAVQIIDADHPTRGSSAPTAIFHPFPGRSMEPKPRRLRLARATVERVERWREYFDAPPIIESTMVRPLRDGHLTERLLETWEGSDAYPDWFEGRRLEGDALHEYGEHLEDFDSAFVYRPAYAIDLDALTARVAERLADKGVAFERPAVVRTAHRDDGAWRLELDDGTLRADRLVLALGPGLEDWFDGLTMRSRGGELLHAPGLDGSDLDHILNAGGHVARHPNGGVVAGSSWWDPEQFDDRTDEQAARDILDRCESLYPPLGETDKQVVWRGVRAIFGDHQPLVGDVAGLEDTFVFGAFGSKGLLRVPLHAEQFSRYLVGESSHVPELSAASRLRDERWEPTPRRIPEQRSKR